MHLYAYFECNKANNCQIIQHVWASNTITSTGLRHGPVLLYYCTLSEPVVDFNGPGCSVFNQFRAAACVTHLAIKVKRVHLFRYSTNATTHDKGASAILVPKGCQKHLRGMILIYDLAGKAEYPCTFLQRIIQRETRELPRPELKKASWHQWGDILQGFTAHVAKRRAQLHIQDSNRSPNITNRRQPANTSIIVVTNTPRSLVFAWLR